MPKRKPTVTKAGTAKAAAEKRRRDFAIAYTSNGRNGKQAAIAAGFSAKTAEVTASKLLREPKVRDLVDKRTTRAEQIMALSADDALRANARVVKFDLGKLYDAEGNPRPLHELDDDTRLALSHKGREGWVPDDRMRALDMAFKNLGLYERDNEQRAESLALEIVLVRAKP